MKANFFSFKRILSKCMKFDDEGFTLVELMVVIAIIGILATALTVYGQVYLQKSRDVSRVVGVSDIAKALFVYSTVQGTFPLATPWGCYPADVLIQSNYLQKPLISPSKEKYDEGCGKNGLYGYGTDGSVMLLMSNMERQNEGNYTGSTIGFTGNLTADTYHTAFTSIQPGTGSIYLKLIGEDNEVSSSSVPVIVPPVGVGNPPPSPPPIAGVCGTANGTTVSSAPSSNLCNAGSAGTVGGSGPWTWSCNGSNGGSNASCSANIQQYTVTFDGNGGSGQSPTTKTVNAGSQVGTLPSDPARSGYAFQGWYTAKTTGTKIYSYSTVNQDTTFYAHWALMQYDYKNKYIDGLVIADPVTKKCTREVGGNVGGNAAFGNSLINCDNGWGAYQHSVQLSNNFYISCISNWGFPMKVTEYNNPSNSNEVAYTCASDLPKMLPNQLDRANVTDSNYQEIAVITYDSIANTCTGYGNWLNQSGFARCINNYSRTTGNAGPTITTNPQCGSGDWGRLVIIPSTINSNSWQLQCVVGGLVP